jgi:hypothetical protein
LNGIPGDTTLGDLSEVSEMQRTILELLLRFSYLMPIGSSKSLQASFFNDRDGYIPSLPDEQWIIEIEAWYRNVLASLQIMFADYAIGPDRRDSSRGRDQSQNRSIIEPQTSAERALCGMQKMRKPTGFV